MIESRKKITEIIIIVAGILFLGFKMAQFYLARNSPVDKEITEAPVVFNLEEAKKTLVDTFNARKKTPGAEKRLRDILQKPEELTALERRTLYGEPQQTIAGGAEEKLSLEGIVFVGDKGNIAIISGKVVTEGDGINGHKVLRIEPDRVILLKNGSEIELKR